MARASKASTAAAGVAPSSRGGGESRSVSMSASTQQGALSLWCAHCAVRSVTTGLALAPFGGAGFPTPASSAGASSDAE